MSPAPYPFEKDRDIGDMSSPLPYPIHQKKSNRCVCPFCNLDVTRKALRDHVLKTCVKAKGEEQCYLKQKKSETSWQRHLRRLTKNRQIWYVACYYGMFPEGLKDCGAIFRTDGLVTHFQPASAKLTDLNRQHRNANSFAKDRKVYLKKVYDSLERELQREGCGASDHK